MMQSVFGYLRGSGKGQIDGHGFARQLETIQKFCVQSGYEIQKVFKEQISGTKDESDRPKFSSMVTAILADGCDTVVVESLALPEHPLSTLRPYPCEYKRMTRGRCGSLPLHRMELPSTTPRQF